MKIVQVSESVSSLAGGLQFSVRQLCLALRRQSCDAIIIAGRDAGKLDGAEVPILFLEKKFDPKLSVIIGLEQEILRERPDVVFQHGVWPPFCWQITSVCKKLGIPYVIHPHGMLDPFILKQSPFLKKMAMLSYQRWNLVHASAFRALNQNEASHIRSIIPNSEVFIAPNGISIAPGDRVDRENKSAGNSILFLGRIDKKKGVVELLQAWKSLSSLGVLPNDASLTIAGWGSDMDYLSAVRSEVESAPRVVFHGPAYGNEKTQLYAHADAFILPSKGEGLPTTVLEAWAMGCVVMCSEECNFSKEQMDRAALNCGNQVQSISVALGKYFGLSSICRSNLIRAGRMEVDDYDWDNVAKSILKDVHALRNQ